MPSIEKKEKIDFLGEGFRNGGGFGMSEWRDTVPLRLVAFNLQNSFKCSSNLHQEIPMYAYSALLCHKVHPLN